MGDRVTDANAWVNAAAPCLALVNDVSTGFSIIARAALIGLKQTRSADQAAAWADQMAAELRQTLD